MRREFREDVNHGENRIQFQPVRTSFDFVSKGIIPFCRPNLARTMKQDGSALELGRYTGAIARSPDGRILESARRLQSAQPWPARLFFQEGRHDPLACKRQIANTAAESMRHCVADR